MGEKILIYNVSSGNKRSIYFLTNRAPYVYWYNGWLMDVIQIILAQFLTKIKTALSFLA